MFYGNVQQQLTMLKSSHAYFTCMIFPIHSRNDSKVHANSNKIIDNFLRYVTSRQDLTDKGVPKSAEIHFFVYKTSYGVVILSNCFTNLLILLASLVLLLANI